MRSNLHMTVRKMCRWAASTRPPLSPLSPFPSLSFILYLSRLFLSIPILFSLSFLPFGFFHFISHFVFPFYFIPSPFLFSPFFSYLCPLFSELPFPIIPSPPTRLPLIPSSPAHHPFPPVAHPSEP